MNSMLLWSLPTIDSDLVPAQKRLRPCRCPPLKRRLANTRIIKRYRIRIQRHAGFGVRLAGQPRGQDRKEPVDSGACAAMRARNSPGARARPDSPVTRDDMQPDWIHSGRYGNPGRTLAPPMNARVADLDREIRAFPVPGFRPFECELNAAARRQFVRRQISDMQSQPGVPGGLRKSCLPIIGGPVHQRRCANLDAQKLAGRQGTQTMTESPGRKTRYGVFHDISGDTLRRRVEDTAILQ